MSQGQDTSPVEISRVWKFEGEGDGVVHIELSAGGEQLSVNLKQGRNPRMYEFIVKHADIATEARPAKEPSES